MDHRLHLEELVEDVGMAVDTRVNQAERSAQEILSLPLKNIPLGLPQSASHALFHSWWVGISSAEDVEMAVDFLMHQVKF